MKKELKFMFDYGNDTSCLWDVTPVRPATLPLSEGVKQEMLEMQREFNTCIDWSNPGGPSPWSDEQTKDFYRRAKLLYNKIAKELGEEYNVINQYKEDTGDGPVC